MPVRRLGTTPRAPIVAFQHELDGWMSGFGSTPPRHSAASHSTTSPIKSRNESEREQVDFRVNLNAEDSALLRKGGAGITITVLPGG
jgi:hypothetical protein